jgi:hypothetical protein
MFSHLRLKITKSKCKQNNESNSTLLTVDNHMLSPCSWNAQMQLSSPQHLESKQASSQSIARPRPSLFCAFEKISAFTEDAGAMKGQPIGS